MQLSVNRRNTVFLLIFFLYLSSFAHAYKVEENKEVHQYIAKEAADVWPLMPYEIRQNINKNSFNDQLDIDGYSPGEGILIAAGEEDTDNCPEGALGKAEDYLNSFKARVCPYYYHGWDPDVVFLDTVPTTMAQKEYSYYGKGFLFPEEFPPSARVNTRSSYRRALEYWDTKVIPLYIRGEKDEAYYWLGRVAHLLEDATVPAHTHIDMHPAVLIGESLIQDDAFEEFTGNNLLSLNYRGLNYSGQQYNYDALPNMDGFNWKDIDPPFNHALLFRLFWYTAQKSQYFASDDADGNDKYRKFKTVFGGSPPRFLADETLYNLPNLWQGDGVTIIDKKSSLSDDDINNNGPTVTTVADASIPHAMKSVAGLYRLFWDTVHSYDWPTYQHDNQRTGFTLLKGDLSTSSNKKGMNLVLSANSGSDVYTRPSIGDIDRNGRMDVVMSFATPSSMGGITAVETIDGKSSQKWSTDVGNAVSAAPSLGDIDGDNDLEVVVGLQDGRLIVIDPDGSENPPIKWSYQVQPKYSPSLGSSITGNLGFTAIADLDHDGTAEIIFTDYSFFKDWPGELYVLRDNGGSYSLAAKTAVNSNDGAEGAVAIANVDSDDNLEIIVPGYYGIKVYDFTGSSLTQKCSTTHAKIYGAPTIYDIDKDNQYEIIYTTADRMCDLGGCSNTLYIIDANTCAVKKSTALDIYSLVSVGIANLDSDVSPEIVIQGRISPETKSYKIEAYDASSMQKQWTYPATSGAFGGFDFAPNIADINGDGMYDIVTAEDTTTVLILNGDGTLHSKIEAGGNLKLGSSPAIGDISGKGVAEIAVKRSGSPISIATTLTGANDKPVLNSLRNITAIAGESITLSPSAMDANGDSLTYYIGLGFDGNGTWQTTVNDTANYSMMVEVSDGNLSDYRHVDVKIFDENTSRVSTFSDGASSKPLAFTGAGSKTVKVRLPKKSVVQFARVDAGGSS